jgi:hypothetical protein
MSAQPALFETELSVAPEPKLYDGRFDWYEAFCRERYSPPSEWQIYKWEAKGEHGKPGAFVLVEGAVFKHTMLKGKRKGRIDYKKPEPGSVATYPIVMTDLDKFKLEWSVKTGKCHHCYGTGQDWFGWNHITGDRYRDCQACSATGSSSLTSKDSQ